jgi:hypothetical protein
MCNIDTAYAGVCVYFLYVFHVPSGTTTLQHTGHVTTHYMIYHPFDLYIK